MNKSFLRVSSLLAATAMLLPAQTAAAGPGIFEGQTDIGTVLHPGSAEFDAAKKTYTVTGSGDNMWAAEDDFHFVWKKVTGDVTLTADVSILTATGDAHRKAALMIRRTLDSDSEYVDAAVHGSGLTALQSRARKGSITSEVISVVTAPKRLSLVKRGNYIYMMVAGEGEPLHFAGGSMRLDLNEPFYVGLAACAHNKDATVQTMFSGVELDRAGAKASKPVLYSTVETIRIAAATDRQAVYVGSGRLDSPMWTKDGKSLVLTNAGKLVSIALTGKSDVQLVPVDTGTLSRIGHHAGISPDGTTLGFTDETGGKTAIYTIPIAGGTPKLITDHASSYFQGWSPDGQTILFCGTRNGKTQILTMPASGGAESTVGTSNDNNDSPEYSPDGRFIYFNSDRTGLMQIWRMTVDGKDETQITTDDFSNWFPHISPNGLQVSFLSYNAGVAGHPNDTDIHVRAITLSTNAIKNIADLVGGPASFHSASWSPDSRSLALVSYQAVQ
jgi:TolB protein